MGRVSGAGDKADRPGGANGLPKPSDGKGIDTGRLGAVKK